MMNFEVLLSAMHLSDFKYIDTLNIKSDCVVINQSDRDVRQEIMSEGRRITYISTKERGLSRSRNMAIDNSKADLCILCDNDVEYVDNYQNIIIDSFAKYPKDDIIVFFIKRDKDSLPYFKNERYLNYITSCKVFSPEIAFRREIINNHSLKFKTEFGAGSKYSMGEENIFLYDCLKAGIKIRYIPIKIAELRSEESTWFKGFTQKFFIDRGATYYAMTKTFSLILVLQFAIRKYKLYKNDMSMFEAVKYMLKGRKQYKSELRG